VQLKYLLQPRRLFTLQTNILGNVRSNCSSFYFISAVQKHKAEIGTIIIVQKRVSKERNIKEGECEQQLCSVRKITCAERDLDS
jgi:hypothetical protein